MESYARRCVAVWMVVSVWMVVALGLVPASAYAGENDGDGSTKADRSAQAPPSENAARSRRLEFDEADAAVERPTGWVDANKGKGALATFRAAADGDAQLEVRASIGISRKKRTSYFNSFHSKLKQAGFSEARKPTPTTYGGKEGNETEYEGTIRKQKFRLIVWTYYAEETAWILAGFFPKSRRDRHYRAFKELAVSLQVGASN